MDGCFFRGELSGRGKLEMGAKAPSREGGNFAREGGEILGRAGGGQSDQFYSSRPSGKQKGEGGDS